MGPGGLNSATSIDECSKFRKCRPERIAIARAIIHNTPILIMDQPSSGLDGASDKMFFEALNRPMEDRTSKVTAHGLSTIRKADLIFAVKDRTIVESGRDEELVKLGGVYAEY